MRAQGGSREHETALQQAFEARGHRLVEQRLRLGSEIENLERELAERESQLAEQRRQIEGLEQTLGASESHIAANESHIAALNAEIEKSTNALHDLLASKSIRYTAPLRAFFGRIHRMVP